MCRLNNNLCALYTNASRVYTIIHCRDLCHSIQWAQKKNSRHNRQALYEHIQILYIVVAVSFHCGFDTENGNPHAQAAAAQVMMF